MNTYRRITYTDRLKIETMLNCGKSQADIARYLGFTRSTICKEIKKGLYLHRNTDYTESYKYGADVAQRYADYNKLSKGKELKIGSDYALLSYIENKIKKEKYSPEATLACIKRENKKFSCTISLKTLYRYIENGVFLNLDKTDLPMYKKKKQKSKKRFGKRACAGVSIEKRPKYINHRKEFGHWEMDTVKGKRGTKSCMLVLTERKTRKEIIRRMPDQTSTSVVNALNNIELKLGKNFTSVFKTITVDNGVEFSNNEGMMKSIIRDGDRTSMFYCHPYSCYERGSNENQNKLIRRHIPKGINFDDKKDDDMMYIENWMNHYPRKMFDYATPDEKFKLELEHLGIEYVL